MPALAVPPASTPSTALSALSLDQAKAALALARGGTVSAAADSIGVHRSSIYNWFKSDPNFKQAIEEVRREWNERLIDEMRRLESLAVEPPTFDTIRHNSTLFAISGGESRPPERPPS